MIEMRLFKFISMRLSFKTNILAIASLGVLLLPLTASAILMPANGNELAQMAGINAKAYVVVDTTTGNVLIDNNSTAQWIPASLTKLVTALVVLDTKPNLKKSVAMNKADQVVGGCSVGGVCVRTANGIKFTIDGLFHASIIRSANNATNTLARSTGLTPEEFAKRMNAKAKALGATNTHFHEPTGMDPNNTTTASDYAKIVTAAFSNKYLRTIAQKESYLLKSTNNTKYNQTIKNTNKLLANSDLNVMGAKTGYLPESKYNFASLLKYRNGPELAIIVLGEKHMYTAYDETQALATLARHAQDLLSLQ